MDINEEIARRRANEARSARQAEAERQAQLEWEQDRQAAMQPKLAALAEKFVRWAGQSGIEPSPLNWHYEKKRFRALRYVPRKDSKYAWILVTYDDSGHNCDSGMCHHITQGSLVIYTTGVIDIRGFRPKSTDLTPAYAEQCIVDFIMKSGSTIPWPG